MTDYWEFLIINDMNFIFSQKLQHILCDIKKVCKYYSDKSRWFNIINIKKLK